MDEHWLSTKTGSGKELNLRMYDANEKIWKMMWQHTSRFKVKDLRAEVREGQRLYLWQVYPMIPEKRIYFEQYAQGHWARIDMRYDEQSAEWVNTFKLEAIREDCQS